jgi:prepilin signal peptidase PulO-like enzyme (type II secretory pathway)
MFGYTKLLLGLGVVLIGLTVVAHARGGPAWERLFSALMGLGFGGGIVWSVRLIAGGALGREAMGFGDVTLMGMIGAWLGWQPALLAFAFAPFAALLIAVTQLVISRHTEIAFGPYLSLGAAGVLVTWGPLWHDWAKFEVFSLGPILLAITVVCLGLMAGMLFGWRKLKERLWAAEE